MCTVSVQSSSKLPHRIQIHSSCYWGISLGWARDILTCVVCVCGASNIVRLRFISYVLFSLHSQRKVTPRIVEQFVWKCLYVAASQKHRHTTSWNPRNVASRLCRICGNTLGMVIWSEAEALIDVAYVQGVAVFTRITHSVSCAIYAYRMASSGKS